MVRVFRIVDPRQGEPHDDADRKQKPTYRGDPGDQAFNSPVPLIDGSKRRICRLDPCRTLTRHLRTRDFVAALRAIPGVIRYSFSATGAIANVHVVPLFARPRMVDSKSIDA
jgi:hypothetical protein